MLASGVSVGASGEWPTHLSNHDHEDGTEGVRRLGLLWILESDCEGFERLVMVWRRFWICRPSWLPAAQVVKRIEKGFCGIVQNLAGSHTGRDASKPVSKTLQIKLGIIDLEGRSEPAGQSGDLVVGRRWGWQRLWRGTLGSRRLGWGKGNILFFELVPQLSLSSTRYPETSASGTRRRGLITLALLAGASHVVARPSIPFSFAYGKRHSHEI